MLPFEHIFFLKDITLGLTFKHFAFPEQSMSGNRVLEMDSVAEAVQLMTRNYP